MKTIIQISVLIILVLSSCRTSKNERALDRVTSNKQLLDKAGKLWSIDNPCNPVEPARPGKIITDTLYNKNKLDSLKNRIDSILGVDCPQAKDIILREIIKIRDTIIINKLRVDTVDKVDNRTLELLRRESSFLDYRLNLEQEKSTELSKSLRKKNLFIIASSLASLLFLGLLAYFLIKRC